MATLLDTLKAQGFDLSWKAKNTRAITVRCSQCEALVINGLACHERNCPNEVHECKGCNATVGRPGQYCDDCR